YNSLIEPHFQYCSTVWDRLAVHLSDKLQKLQNRAARVIAYSSFDTSSEHVLGVLGWNGLHQKRRKQKAIMIFKALNNLV
ncbi:predicted protein, partial [Nematostella vectensis]